MADETQFVHQPITVEYEKAAVGPTALRWGGSLRRVTEVVRQWQDFHTPSYATHATGWLHRRHRNYYLLRL